MTPRFLPPELACLPNAGAIQRVLAHAQAHPEVWESAWLTVWDRQRGVARSLERTLAWDAARQASYRGGREEAWFKAFATLESAERGVIMALIAYDECAYLLDWPVDRIRTHIALTDDPAAILLLPAVEAMSCD